MLPFNGVFFQLHLNWKDTSIAAFDRLSMAASPRLWFGVSAVFHYLGPAFAVLLFPAVGVLGVAWFRIGTAAVCFAPFTRPCRTFRTASTDTRWLLVGLGASLATMNTAFYLALERLPMSLVAAMEFIGTIAVALFSVRSVRNGLALAAAVVGVLLLIDMRWTTNLPGLAWAALNALLFVVYIVLGHRAAQRGASDGVEILGASMMVAFLFVMPIGISHAIVALTMPGLVLAGIGVGICSSVIPYVCDQLAMSRLPRASFALLLALLPATAAIIAAIVLGQFPDRSGVLGILLVILGVAIHTPVYGPKKPVVHSGFDRQGIETWRS